MPGTPMAKSASLFSANSLTWRGDITCSASDLRSSGRMAACGSASSSPCTRSVGGRPTLRCRSEAFCLIISCRIALKLNCGAAPAAGAAAGAVDASGGVGGVAGGGLAIGGDPEKHLPVLHGVCVLHQDFLYHACVLRF